MSIAPGKAVSSFPWPRFALLSAGAGGLYALAGGVLTGVIPNPVFHRIVALDIWNLLALVVPAALFGALAATYLVPWPKTCTVSGRAGAGGVLSFLAAGCPLCNKLVVVAIGASGAMNLFRPIQPLLGAASVILLGAALWTRFRVRQRV
jgi:hypothetical protein